MSAGLNPETSWNHTSASGVNAMADRPAVDTAARPAAKLRRRGNCRRRGPSRAMAASRYDRPMARKMNVRPCTTGSTARDSSVKRAWPMKNVTSGWTDSAIVDVMASGA